MCERVFIKNPGTIVYSSDGLNKAEIVFKNGQRWYLVGMEDDFVTLERDIVRLQMRKVDFYDMFDVVRR